MSTDTDEAPSILRPVERDVEGGVDRTRYRAWLKYGLGVALLCIAVADLTGLSGNVDTVAMGLGLTLMVVGLLRTRPVRETTRTSDPTDREE